MKFISLERFQFPVDVEVIPGRLVPTEAQGPLPNSFGFPLPLVVCHSFAKDFLHGRRVKVSKIKRLAPSDFWQRGVVGQKNRLSVVHGLYGWKAEAFRHSRKGKVQTISHI